MINAPVSIYIYIYIYLTSGLLVPQEVPNVNGCQHATRKRNQLIEAQKKLGKKKKFWVIMQ